MNNGIQVAHNNAVIAGAPLSAPSLARYPSAAVKQGVVADTFQHEFTTNTFLVGPQVVSLAGANKNRRYLLIQNTGGFDIYVDFGGTPVYAQRGILLPAGTNIVFENGIVPNNEVRAVCTPTTTVVVCEGIQV